GAQTGVLYPRKENANFDMDYYLSKHMPFCERTWKPYGPVSWRVAKLGPEYPYT
ncbi:hypothetical protein BU23DRAFT_414053, partial [Bimuria novae-zelandiae CBS 107.79]